MPLLMLDLDNTLVDRDVAFRDAAAVFLAEHALPESDIEWLMSTDASGYTPRQAVATAAVDRYGASLPETAIRIFLDRGATDRVVLAEATRDALSKATTHGWSCTIVTNGRTVQQEANIRNTGLDRLVHGWAISEEVGHQKPEPEIFKAAATAVGASLHEAWVIGDSPQADIAGANGLGVPSVWVSGGRPWTEAAYRPTHVTDDVASAIHYVIGIQR
ncbi:HAD family hydrolase [Streptomyces sp. NPDC059627]